MSERAHIRDKAVVLYGRLPEKGLVKTRLAGKLGEDATLALYEATLADTAWKLGQVRDADRIAVMASGGARGATPDEPPRDWLGLRAYDRFEWHAQEGREFGERLCSTMRRVLDMGYRRVVLVGADSPELEVRDLEAAFDMLATRDLVLGPAEDGGYYLIAMRRFCGAVFEGIEWSTSVVLRQTLEAAAQHGLSTGLVATRPDLDYFEDLVRMAARRRPALARAEPSPCPTTDAWLSGRLPGQERVPADFLPGGAR